MVRSFESGFADMFGIDYAISVNSATSGLTAALGACDIAPMDEVITTCLSFNATALSLLPFNAVPVFGDVDEKNFCINPDKIEENITERTKAIVVVHLLGNTADMDRIMAIAKKHDLKVIEDCAQAPGVKYKGKFVGTIGHAGVFSFQETKNISTGEGGMIVTNDKRIARKCRLIRNHGESIPDEKTSDADLINVVGFNFRMTELTAAMGLAQLDKLNENNRWRQENAKYLFKELKAIPGLSIPEVVIREGHICHVFPMVYQAEKGEGIHRDLIIDALRAEGLIVGTGYVRLIPENPIFSRKIAYGGDGWPFVSANHESKVSYDVSNFPVAKKLIMEQFIWFYHVNRPNTIEDMKDVVAAFKKVFLNLNELKMYQPENRKLIYKW
jgi:dTDP-4-amino-4,6-dideoxygalactose transaminase